MKKFNQVDPTIIPTIHSQTQMIQEAEALHLQILDNNNISAKKGEESLHR